MHGMWVDASVDCKTHCLQNGSACKLPRTQRTQQAAASRATMRIHTAEPAMRHARTHSRHQRPQAAHSCCNAVRCFNFHQLKQGRIPVHGGRRRRSPLLHARQKSCGPEASAKARGHSARAQPSGTRAGSKCSRRGTQHDRIPACVCSVYPGTGSLQVPLQARFICINFFCAETTSPNIQINVWCGGKLMLLGSRGLRAAACVTKGVMPGLWSVRSVCTHSNRRSIRQTDAPCWAGISHHQAAVQRGLHTFAMTSYHCAPRLSQSTQWRACIACALP